MSESLNSLKIFFEGTKQPRAQKTLDDLLEAAEKIVEGADADDFNARSLAKASGYSLGTLIKRLGAIENIFLFTITVARSKKLHKFAQEMHGLGADAGVKAVAEKIVDRGFVEISRVGLSVIRYYEKRAFKRLSDPTKVFAYTSEMVAPLLELIESDKTGTFRKLTHNEAVYVCRAIFMFVERPFVENDPMAGTEAHRAMAIENICALLEMRRGS